MIAALRRHAQGRDQEGRRRKWFTHGFLLGFASPVMDEADACSTRWTTARSCSALRSQDAAQKLWSKKLGTLQKGSPVLADGKLYVGTENGKFYILKPSQDRRRGARRGPASAGGTGDAEPARADRRVAGRRRRPRLRGLDGRALRDRAEGAEGRAGGAARHGRGAARPRRRAPAVAQVFPYDVTLKPGQAQKFTVTCSTPRATSVARSRHDDRLGAGQAEGHGRAGRQFTPDAAAGSQGGASRRRSAASAAPRASASRCRQVRGELRRLRPARRRRPGGSTRPTSST